MEMNGRSTVSYLVLTPRVPLTGLEAKGLLAFQARRGIASVVRWNLRPVILESEKSYVFVLFKAQLGEPFLGILIIFFIFSFFLSSVFSLFVGKPALKRAKIGT